MTRIVLKSIDAAAGQPGHLIHANESPSEAAMRIAFGGNDTLGNHWEGIASGLGYTAALVATQDPMIFEIEPLCDEAVILAYDEEGEVENVSFDISKHAGCVGAQ